MYQKRKFPYAVFSVLLLLFLSAGYLASGLLVLPEEVAAFSEESLSYLFANIFSLWNEKTVAFMGIGVLIWMYLICYYLQYHRNFHANPHGSSGWRDVHEACETYMDHENPENNRILTQNLQVSLDGALPNNNMLVIASSGDYKTTSSAEQNLLQMQSSYIMLDVKGDTCRKLGNKFKKCGYDVRVLNFKEPSKSDRFNPFVNIEKEDDLLRAIRALHEACRPPQNMSTADPFWDDAVKLYLQSMFYASWLDGRRNGTPGTMNDVMRLANMESKRVVIERGDDVEEVTELKLYMDELAAQYGADYPPVRDYRKLKEGAPDTVNTVILMVNSMLSICETGEVKRIFSGNDINIREIGSGVGGNPKKKTILFLVIPDNNNVYNWIVSMFYNQALDILIRHSDEELHKPLPIRVEFWLDEIYAGARPNNTVELLGVVRSRNICLIPILQSVSQIKDLYKSDKWEIIMDNVAVVLFLGSGPTALSTHEFFSKILGKATIDVQHDNVHFGQNPNSALNFNQQGRELMTPEEVKELPTTDAIVFLKSSKPIYDTKAIPFDKPALKYRAPKWLKDRYSEALSYGLYEHPVHTVYDPVHFTYITVEPDMPYQIITDRKEIETYQEAAKTDPTIFTFTVKESELLYLSWGHGKCTKERAEEVYKKIQEDEKQRRQAMRGLIVMQNREDVEEILNPQEKATDKTGWNKYTSLAALLRDHWEDMSAPEQEQICMAFADNLTEEQILTLAVMEQGKMEMLRQIYMRENKEMKAR